MVFLRVYAMIMKVTIKWFLKVIVLYKYLCVILERLFFLGKNIYIVGFVFIKH